MCQPKPGPRCSPDTAKKLASARRREAIAFTGESQAQLDIMRRNLLLSEMDYASTPDGQSAAVDALTHKTTVGLGKNRVGVSTYLDESTGHVMVTMHDLNTSRPLAVYSTRDIDSGAVIDGDDLGGGVEIDGETIAGLRRVSRDLSRAHMVQRTGVALDRSRRDQVALMPQNPGKGSAGYEEYIALAEARDALAWAEARYGARVALGQPVPRAEKEALAVASQQVRSADVAYRRATHPGIDRAGLAAMPEEARAAAQERLDDPATPAWERDNLVGATHEYASDQAWTTFDRPQYAPSQLAARPAAPWVRHTRPLADADLARITQITKGRQVEVVGTGQERTVVIRGGATAPMEVWAAGYTAKMPAPGDTDLVVMAGPNFTGWAGSRSKLASAA